jgi:16S rRNA (guanine527-N7)-methyltransferase
MDEISEAIRNRLLAARLDVPVVVVGGCARYVALLRRWNARINLTALPVSEPIADSTVDKLIVEPLIGHQLFPSMARTWIDIGSGGGSPAVPLRIAHPVGALVMVESRSRKCAFLREVTRQLGLPSTTVENVRFDALVRGEPADVITTRAVRLDAELLDEVSVRLRLGGSLIGFGAVLEDQRFSPVGERALPDGSRVTRWERTGD